MLVILYQSDLSFVLQCHNISRRPLGGQMLDQLTSLATTWEDIVYTETVQYQTGMNSGVMLI